MEVECRSRNDPRCRFLSAAPETLNVVYDQMMRGTGYEEVLEGGRGGGSALASRHGHPLKQQRRRVARPVPPAVVPEPADLLQQLVRVPRHGGILDATGDLAPLDAIGERHRVAERPADHVSLSHADQLIHDQAVPHVAEQATPELAHRLPFPASLFSDEDRKST